MLLSMVDSRLHVISQKDLEVGLSAEDKVSMKEKMFPMLEVLKQ